MNAGLPDGVEWRCITAIVIIPAEGRLADRCMETRTRVRGLNATAGRRATRSVPGLPRSAGEWAPPRYAGPREQDGSVVPLVAGRPATRKPCQ